MGSGCRVSSLYFIMEMLWLLNLVVLLHQKMLKLKLRKSKLAGLPPQKIMGTMHRRNLYWLKDHNKQDKEDFISFWGLLISKQHNWRLRYLDQDIGLLLQTWKFVDDTQLEGLQTGNHALLGQIIVHLISLTDSIQARWCYYWDNYRCDGDDFRIISGECGMLAQAEDKWVKSLVSNWISPIYLKHKDGCWWTLWSDAEQSALSHLQLVSPCLMLDNGQWLNSFADSLRMTLIKTFLVQHLTSAGSFEV